MTAQPQRDGGFEGFGCIGTAGMMGQFQCMMGQFQCFPT
jgi:hypothetical protein